MAGHQGKSTCDKDLKLLGSGFQLIQPFEVDYEMSVNDQVVLMVKRKLWSNLTRGTVNSRACNSILAEISLEKRRDKSLGPEKIAKYATVQCNRMQTV